MSVETPPTPDSPYRHRESQREDIRYVAARVMEWMDASPDAWERPEALDARPRRWDVVNPSATRIGHPADPDDDVDERLRALHAERRAALQGNSDRRDRLDVARITQAVCNSLDLTAWERDRVLGVVCELDSSVFGEERTIPRTALVVARRVVDAERRAWLGLDDADGPPERLARLSDRLHRLTDSDEYDRLFADCDLTAAIADRLDDAVEAELDEETLREATMGRSPYRDPYLPPAERRLSGRDVE